MPWPNFLLIGAAKSGTTSLYHYLRQHPQIYMPQMKGPRFFAMEGVTPAFAGPRDEIVNRRTVTTAEEYTRLFDAVRCETAIGEASDWYLSSERAVERIRHYIPAARLVAILRHPAERAFSSYMHFARHGFEPLPFEQALAAEDMRLARGWSPLFEHRGRGFYGAQLTRYYRVFERSKIRIYLYEDLQQDPVALMHDLFGFLEVEESFTPNTDIIYNKSGTARSQRLDRFLNEESLSKNVLKSILPRRFRRYLKTAIRNRNYRERRMPESVRAALTASYRQDILQLQELIRRDLSHWLNT